jgi:hexosaminidase
VRDRRIMNKINIVPYPKKVIGCNNSFLIKESYTIVIPTDNNEKIMPVAERLKKIIYEEMNLDLMICVGNVGNSNQIITFINCSLMPPEAYNIYITGKQLIIEYSNEAGAFYATSTMKQVLKSHSKIPFNRIEDAPDYKVRGVMLDISRNKIPTMDTLFGLIDFLADLKINQLQLYVEGFSFAYPSFPQVWQNGTPITSEEIKRTEDRPYPHLS